MPFHPLGFPVEILLVAITYLFWECGSCASWPLLSSQGSPEADNLIVSLDTHRWQTLSLRPGNGVLNERDRQDTRS